MAQPGTLDQPDTPRLQTEGRVIAQTQSAFVSLPDELLLSVFEYCADDSASLTSLARTCQALQPFAEAQIYSHIRLVDTAQITPLMVAFSSRPARLENIVNLDILYDYKTVKDSRHRRSIFNARLHCMSRIKELWVESPFDNFSRFMEGSEWYECDMVEIRDAIQKATLADPGMPSGTVGMEKLEKFILHTHGRDSDYWDLHDFDCVFLLPSLRYLHVSCVEVNGSFPKLDAHKGTSPLQTLIFDECNLYPRALSTILATPRSLKELTLGENIHNMNPPKATLGSTKFSTGAVMASLKLTAHSLEKLTHLNRDHLHFFDGENSLPHKRAPLPGAGLQAFDKLKYVECDKYSFLHKYITQSPVLAPPNLETYRLLGHRYETEVIELLEHPPDFYPFTRLPNLKCIEVLKPLGVESVFEVSNRIWRPDRARSFHAWAYKLWKFGIRTKLLVQLHRETLIPPYLYGEPKPLVVEVYDSDEVGFIRAVTDDTDIEDEDGDDFDEDWDSSSSESSGSEPDVEAKETPLLNTGDIKKLYFTTRRRIDDLLRQGIYAYSNTDSDLSVDSLRSTDSNVWVLGLGPV